MKNKNKKSLLMGIILSIIVLMIDGTFALWEWYTTSEKHTFIDFTVTPTFSCGAAGGGDITAGEITLIPTECTDSEHVIKRKITTTVENTNGSPVYLNLWFNVNTLGSYLSNNENFRYTMSTSDSCTENIVASGNFNNVLEDKTIRVLDVDRYEVTEEREYYLYIYG